MAMSTKNPSKNGTENRLEWTCNLSIDDSPFLDRRRHRKTGIICTIGPKTATPEMIGLLRKAGMSTVRLNFSHGSHEYHGGVIETLRMSERNFPDWSRPISIALDTKGPEIRCGLFSISDEGNGNGNNTNDEQKQQQQQPRNWIKVLKDSKITITTDSSFKVSKDPSMIYCDYVSITESCPVGSLIYIDDGNLQLRVDEIVDTKTIKTTSLNTHKLPGGKGINLPFAEVKIPALTDKDKEDLRFGVRMGVDMVFASFIQKASDVQLIREVIDEELDKLKAAVVIGASEDDHRPHTLITQGIKIVSKIENYRGVQNIKEIIAASDGIMVARGDLGIEIPAEKVFVAQKMIIALCNVAGKPVICATQMLESMTQNPRPTRAEASDVANAVLDGADCVMLSAETASGDYPIQAVEMMSKICLEAEGNIAYGAGFEELKSVIGCSSSVTEAIACSAVNASQPPDYVRAIIILSTTGDSARQVAKYRPHVPIITVTRDSQTSRQIHLHRSCYPFYYGSDEPASPSLSDAGAGGSIEWQMDVDRRFQWAMDKGKDIGMLESGDVVILIQGMKGGHGFTNNMRMITVP